MVCPIEKVTLWVVHGVPHRESYSMGGSFYLKSPSEGWNTKWCSSQESNQRPLRYLPSPVCYPPSPVCSPPSPVCYSPSPVCYPPSPVRYLLSPLCLYTKPHVQFIERVCYTLSRPWSFLVTHRYSFCPLFFPSRYHADLRVEDESAITIHLLVTD